MVFLGNASTCRQIPQSSQMRDVEWATNTCTITFTTVGIWPENADGTDVNYCDRSHNGTLLATGDDFGKVKLYTYPVTQPRVRLKIFYVYPILICHFVFRALAMLIQAIAATLPQLHSYKMIQDLYLSEAMTPAYFNGL